MHVGQWAQSVFAAAQQAWPQDGFAAGHVEAPLWQQADLQPVRRSAEAQRRSASIFMVFIFCLERGGDFSVAREKVHPADFERPALFVANVGLTL